MSILLHGCTTWTLTKRLERKLDGNYTRMLRAVLNKSRRQHPTRHQLYGHLPPITKTIQVRRTRHAGHCWRSKELVYFTPGYWPAKHPDIVSHLIQNLSPFTWVKKKFILLKLFEKSAIELKPNSKKKLLWCKSTVHIASFNVRTFNRIGQLPELRTEMDGHLYQHLPGKTPSYGVWNAPHFSSLIITQQHQKNTTDNDISYI